MNSVPVAALQNPYCEIMDNCRVDNGYVYLRNGDASRGLVSGSNNVKGLAGHANSGKLFQAVNHSGGAGGFHIYDVTTSGAFSDVYSIAGADTCDLILPTEFKGYLYIFGNDSLSTFGGVYFDGTTWASTAYTLSGGLEPVFSFVYKHRHYLVDQDSNLVGYSDIDAVTGSLTVKDFSNIFETSGYIIGGGAVSMSDNVEAQTFFVLINSQGEIVAFQGNYPDSDTWGIATRFKLPTPPTSYRGFIKYRGDIVVITSSGLYSIRDLFLKGNQATGNLALSAAIAPRWKQIFKSYFAQGVSSIYIQGCWDELNNRFIIMFPWYVDRNGFMHFGGFNTNNGQFLIYDIEKEAWNEDYTSPTSTGNGIESLLYFNKSTFFCSHSTGFIWRKEAATNFLDANESGSGSNGIKWQIRSAPIENNKFGTTDATGVEMIIQSDLYDEFSVGFILDLGRITTDAQDIPLQGTTVEKPLYNIGGEATYVQWQILGTTTGSASTGFKLFAVNVWAEQGEGR